MATALTARQVAKRLGLSDEEFIARLRLRGLEVLDGSQVLDSTVIRAIVDQSEQRAPSPRFLTACDSCGIQIETATIPSRTTPLYCPDCHAQRRAYSQRDGDASYDYLGAMAAGASATDSHMVTALRDILMRDYAVVDQIFVVHGHHAIKHEIANFLRSIGLQPILLDERPNKGRTILEKLEDYSIAAFALVLLTPDDVGAARAETEFRPRARQNVILELGYFLARLGRNRVCAMYVPPVELPSDVHGLLYIEIDNSGGWKYRLLREFKAAGILVKPDAL